MRKHFVLLTILLCMLGFQTLLAQRSFRTLTPSPEEIVSLSRTTTFDQAVVIFNELSKKYLGKVILDANNFAFPIGVNIKQVHWLTALETILRANGMWYEEKTDYLLISPPEEASEDSGPRLTKDELYAREFYNTREVSISAVFFEADVNELRQAGIDWSYFRNDKLDLSATSNPTGEVGGLLEVEINPDLDFADITAIFKTLESNAIGEVLTSPSVTVRSGEEGNIQVGSDISVTLQDFAGNAVTQFISTGSIITVKPEILRYDSVDFIALDMRIERSSGTRGEGGLEINKSKAESSVLLLDGEETVIGGLYINNNRSERAGIPFLKDLPGWFFGLRYVFGFEQTSTSKRELLILLKAELLPTIRSRFQAKMQGAQRKKLLQEQRRRNQLQMKLYEMQTKTK